MKRNHIQHTIATYLQHQPVDKAWLFGSYARGEATRRSDVDILVKYTPNSNLSLLDHIHIMNELQRLLHKKVDLVKEGCLCSFAVDNVNQDKILIYERTAER
jgi:predicted nucleotidyltransferase